MGAYSKNVLNKKSHNKYMQSINPRVSGTAFLITVKNKGKQSLFLLYGLAT